MPAAVRTILSGTEQRMARYRAVYALCYLLGGLLAISMLLPLAWVFLAALKEPAEIMRVPPTLLPARWDWTSFAEAWRRYQIPRMALNTTVVYLGYVASRLMVITLAAYALARLAVPFRRVIYMVFLATLMLPDQALLVPKYLVIASLPVIKVSLINTWWALWLPAGVSSFQLLLMKGFFDDIPRDLSEAARIDGASEVRTLWSIILPNSKPIVAVVAIFAFFEIWNNFFWQRLILTAQAKWTMAVMVWFHTYTIGGNPALNVQLAGACISIVPPLVLFLVFQRFITQGITMTGLKG
jgi:multiple sugar transport system permease protein